MSSRLVFDWDINPGVMVAALTVYERGFLSALRALFNVFAAKIASYAQRTAPWIDRTGAARQGLFSFVEGGAGSITLYLVTSVVYGLYLELGTRYMAPRPVVMPSLQAHYAELVAAIAALLRAF